MSTTSLLSKQRFTFLYFLYTIPITLLSFPPVTQFYNNRFNTTNFYSDINPLGGSIILSVIAFISVPISYLAQKRWAYKVFFTQPFTVSQAIIFAFAFYICNIIVSVILSIVGTPLFLITLFVYIGYPITFLLYPSHLLIGLLLATHLFLQDRFEQRAYRD